MVWRYADPDGSEHNTVNCSIADARADRRTATAQAAAPAHGPGAAAYELGMRETDHGLPVQPFTDP